MWGSMLERLLRRPGGRSAVLGAALVSLFVTLGVILWRIGGGQAAGLGAAFLLALAVSSLARRGPFGETLLASWVMLGRARPRRTSSIRIPSLTAPADAGYDRWGIPTITARSRLDAIRALGYVSARDRLFQMDLFRREAAGTLCEVVGLVGLEKDARRRVLGLSRAAPRIALELPREHRNVLQAYADGVNAFLSEGRPFPYEFLVLGYEPHAWAVEDSLLALLHLFLALCGDDRPQRMLTILESSLPP